MNKTTRARKVRLACMVAASAAVLTVGLRPALAADVKAGQAAAAVCVACHQADGGGMAAPGAEPWPALAGLDAGYIAKQLHDFRSGARTSASMQPFAQMLDESQIRDVAAYYASLPAPSRAAPSTVDRELFEHGRKLVLQGDWERYVVSCVACHGPDAAGVGSTFPGIAGQLPEYLRVQLRAYRDGARSNDPLDLMGAIARRMTDRDIEAVSLWLGAQTVAGPAK